MRGNLSSDILFGKVKQDLSKVKGVKSSLIASRDGFILGSTSESYLEKYAMASAVMLRTADAAVSKMGQDCSQRVVIDYPNERLVATRAGPKAFVAVLTGPGIGLDPLISELNKAAEKVKEVL